ncbi:hypothetical protein L6452_34067 [Arctium lappa]|uniref:Uncharacterized protein n=1 Tax=Arctium lappa TaxID=4217 RepID=A0ACB8YID2_ARCLA|nr:hypothetical protein L6452_34067 [Arctium lappa]
MTGALQIWLFGHVKIVEIDIEISLHTLFALAEYIVEETEHLSASVDFLVELCDTPSIDDTNFANWSHQAVDFILDAIKNILSKGKNIEPVEGIVGSLSLRLVRKMCTTLQGNER